MGVKSERQLTHTLQEITLLLTKRRFFQLKLVFNKVEQELQSSLERTM